VLRSRAVFELRLGKCNSVAMTQLVEKIAKDVQALREEELDEFLAWLADYSLEREEQEWDAQIARDAQPGGPLDKIVQRARADIAAGRTLPLDEFLDNT
jgi:hypothetical protein